MISKRLNTLIFLAIPLFALHGFEEYVNDFYRVDPISRFVFQPFQNMDSLQATFLLFQIMIFFLLCTSFLLLQGKKFVLFILTFFGLVFIFELHHLYKALVQFSYYPGLMTALVIYILGFFYWKELLSNWRRI